MNIFNGNGASSSGTFIKLPCNGVSVTEAKLNDFRLSSVASTNGLFVPVTTIPDVTVPNVLIYILLSSIESPASVAARSSCSPNNAPSTSCIYEETCTVLPGKFTKSSVNCLFCTMVSRLGAISDSRAIILDCCESLIRSSKAKRQTVQIDSTVTPLITSHFAIRWREVLYSSDSNMIPAPTEIPANTLPNIKTR